MKRGVRVKRTTTSATSRWTFVSICCGFLFLFPTRYVRISHTRCIGYRQIAFGEIENKEKIVVELEPFVVAGRIEFHPPRGTTARGQSSVDKSDLKTEIKTIWSAAFSFWIVAMPEQIEFAESFMPEQNEFSQKNIHDVCENLPRRQSCRVGWISITTADRYRWFNWFLSRTKAREY